MTLIVLTAGGGALFVTTFLFYRLHKSEKRFKALADNSPLAIAMSEGVDQRYGYVNPTCTKLFGYTKEELGTVLGWFPLAYPDESYRDQISKEWQKRIALAIENNSAIEPMETIVTCKDGSTKNILWGYISTGEQNWAYGLDITERRQAEKEIKILQGILPICACCKKIRDKDDKWSPMENYISKHSHALFSHGFCPDCFEKEMVKIKEYKSRTQQ
jgi:PAS domain S-box-containing protein